MANMFNGAECSGSNAMMQFSKKFQEDKSLQRDRVHDALQSGSSTGQGVFRQAGPGPSLMDQEMVKEFFQQQQAGAEGREMGNHPFEFSQLHGELADISVLPPDVAPPMQVHGFEPKLGALAPAEQEAFNQAFSVYEHMPANWRNEFLNHHAQQPVKFGPEEEAALEAAFARHADWSTEFAQHDVKGNSQKDWTKEFEPTVDDENNAQKVQDEMMSKFEALWNQDLEDDVGEDDWQSQFQRTLAGGPYTFETDNPYMQHPDPLAEGQRLRHEGGSLTEAALAFEAAVQGASSDNADVWRELGEVQAENEKESAAVRALERSLELDSGCLAAYVPLAVSLVNEGYDRQAYATLERWLRERYPDLPIVDGAAMSMELRDRIIDSFLIAARNSDGISRDMDPDVQVGLGILFYGGGEYTKAVDCFVSALESRPQDYLLWNRLGATLANSGKSEEAISAYHRALDIKPTFVRARYNLGVSCVNIGCHREAVEHLLGALAMHDNKQTTVNVSASLWETLRRSFYMMDRADLAELAQPGANLDQFKGEFDF
ncbi:hypothetical protein BDF19DRAFT_430102 [Syncephalis fuscata]|nr:hypothetical protein BDF19DRAFT_430102 [Syncephalis fuscata]